MALFETVRDSLNTAVDTISTITNTIIEKNRTNAQLNRLRLVMKNESEMINRAYIALGKNYYEGSKSERGFVPPQNQAELFEVIETSKKRIKKARERYSQILENQTVEIYEKFDDSTLEDITVACSNEDEYEASPFPVKEEVEEVKDAVKSTVEDVAENVSKNAAEKLLQDEKETDEGFSF